MKGARRVLLSILSLFLFVQVAAADSRYVPAFVGFVQDGKYDDANYYVQQGYIEQGDIDPAQVLFDVINNKYRWSVADNLPAIDTLIGYLGNFGAFDLNRPMTCRNEGQCGYAYSLITTAQPLYIIEKFVGMGLDLNQTVPGRVPNELLLLVHLGSAYGLEDINRLVALGLKLGSQTFNVQDVMSLSYNHFYDPNDYHTSELTMPAGYGSLRGFNFLDMLVLIIGSLRDSTEAYSDGPGLAAKTDFLCSFALHAAPSYTTSFDYLSYLLSNRVDFRPGNMGYIETNRRTTFIPFGESCVSLVTAMAANHADIRRIIDNFAARGDTTTASWLQSLSVANATPQPAPAQ